MKKFFKLFVCFCLVASTLCGIWACDDISTDNPSEETTTAATTQNPDDPAQRPGETTGSKPTSKPTSKPGSTTEEPRPDYSTRLPNKDWDGKELIVIGNNSGRCLLSNYMTGRDSNRGACAQPCRYQYVLMEEKRPGEYFPVFEDEKGTYILNSRDMCMIDHLDELMNAGVDCIKIEGRAKSAYYAAASSFSSNTSYSGLNFASAACSIACHC